MKKIQNTTLDEFYKQAEIFTGRDVNSLLTLGITNEIGHFNVFEIYETVRQLKQKQIMPYNRRAYYKISLIRGKNRAEYADKVIDIEKNALLFATPKIPYHWFPLDENQSGSFCVFTDEFMIKNKTAVVLDDLPIFKSGGYPVFEITENQADEIALIFTKMKREIASDYEFKYDLLRNYVLELIHHGQKLQPASALHSRLNASARIVSPTQKLGLRAAGEYAERLAIHVNHLNKVIKENTGKTTSDIIGARLTQEAKILLKQTNWNIAEIAYALGFEEVAHFSNFLKKLTSLAPLKFRS